MSTIFSAYTARVTIASVLVVGALMCASLPAWAQFTQQGAKLVGTGVVSGAEQGSSVALSADGNTAIVGGHYDNDFAGAAWVFIRSGGVWTQQGSKLVGTGAVGSAANQGVSVALSADGNTAIVGGTGRQRWGWGGMGIHPRRRRLDPARIEAGRHRRCRKRRRSGLSRLRCLPTATLR